MNRLVALAVLAFSIALAFLIGQRLSDQAMAVIVGSVIGVAASLPMTAIVLWLTLRQREVVRQSSNYGRSDPPPRDETPRMIIVQPQPYAAPQYAPQLPMGYLNPPAPAMASYPRPARDFKIVGQEEFDDEDRNAVV